MNELTPEDRVRKDALSRKLCDAVTDYNGDVSDANDLIEKANDSMEAARKKLNAVLKEVDEFRNGVVDRMNTHCDVEEAKDGDFLYTPFGKAWDDWRGEWAGTDFTEVKDASADKFEELDDGTDSLMADLPDRPPTK